MRKIIAAINMTLDGFCDHTAVNADDEIHKHYNTLFLNADTLLWGRKTYQLMESYWPFIVKEPTGNKPTDEFAILVDNISKVVFSRTLSTVEWKNTMLKSEIVRNEIVDLKQQPGKDIFAGSPSLISQLTDLGLIDEYQLCINPVILGSGLPLFKVGNRTDLKLIETKTFDCGVVLHYYEPAKN